MDLKKQLLEFLQSKIGHIIFGGFAVIIYTLVVVYISVSLTSKAFYHRLEDAKPKLYKVVSTLKRQSLEIARLKNLLKDKKGYSSQVVGEKKIEVGKPRDEKDNIFKMIEKVLIYSEPK